MVHCKKCGSRLVWSYRNTWRFNGLHDAQIRMRMAECKSLDTKITHKNPEINKSPYWRNPLFFSFFTFYQIGDADQIYYYEKKKKTFVTNSNAQWIRLDFVSSFAINFSTQCAEVFVVIAKRWSKSTMHLSVNDSIWFYLTGKWKESIAHNFHCLVS